MLYVEHITRMGEINTFPQELWLKTKYHQKEIFDILLTVHLNIFILILNNLMH